MIFGEMPSVWAGDATSLREYLHLRNSIEADPSLVKAYSALRDEPEEPESRLLHRAGDVSVIEIHGPLVNSNSWLNQLFGMTGYPEIIDALVEAAQDPETRSIALRINSGGGDASGVEEVGALIQRISSEFKPVVSHTSGIMASAAYWIGSAADGVFSTTTATVGSIGTLAVQQEVTKMLEEDGVTPTVFRSGKYKALGNPYEVLSDEARDVIQAQVDTLGKLFTEQVAANRNVSYETANDVMGQGKTFIGKQASEVGLTDGIVSFDQLVQKMQGGVDFLKYTSKDEQKFLMDGNTMTKVLASAMANTAKAEVETAAQVAEGAQVGAVEEPKQIAEAAAPTGADAILLLTDQLLTARTEALTSKAEVTALQAQVAQLQVEAEAMKPALTMAVSRLQVALGTSAEVADMDVASLVAHHDNLQTQFQSKFKAGGVAQVTTVPDAEGHENTEASADMARHAARIKATRLTK